MKKLKSAVLMGLSAMTIAGASQAALVTETFSIDFGASVGGFIDATAYNNAVNGDANPGEPDFTQFAGLISSGMATGTITYDDAVNNITTNASTGITTVDQVNVSFNLGGTMYDQTNDVGWGTDPAAPQIKYDNGTLVSLLFIVDSTVLAANTGDIAWEFAIDGNLFEILDFRDPNFNHTPVIASGLVNYNPAVVPVPAAVWLFGSGLLGLVGIARRKA